MAEKKMDKGKGPRRSVSPEKETPWTYPLSDDNFSSTASPQTQGIISTYEKGSPSRKRNPSQESEAETKKPRYIMIFGARIPIPDEEAADAHQSPPRNPNPHPAHPLIQRGLDPRIFEGIEQGPAPLFEKELQNSDVLPNQNRLLISGHYWLMTALTEEERRKVEVKQEAGYLRVMAWDANGGKYTMHLKRWTGSGAIVLIHEWGKFVRANNLQRGDSVEGWGYRVGGEFRLALTITRKKSN